MSCKTTQEPHNHGYTRYSQWRIRHYYVLKNVRETTCVFLASIYLPQHALNNEIACTMGKC